MGRHAYKPTTDELTQASYVAWLLKGVTNVRVTEHAVYAFGAEAWVCPSCLKPNHTVRNGSLPLAPRDCERCGSRLT